MKRPGYFLIVGIIVFLCLTCLPNALALDKIVSGPQSGATIDDGTLSPIKICGYYWRHSRTDAWLVDPGSTGSDYSNGHTMGKDLGYLHEDRLELLFPLSNVLGDPRNAKYTLKFRAKGKTLGGDILNVYVRPKADGGDMIAGLNWQRNEINRQPWSGSYYLDSGFSLIQDIDVGNDALYETQQFRGSDFAQNQNGDYIIWLRLKVEDPGVGSDYTVDLSSISLYGHCVSYPDKPSGAQEALTGETHRYDTSCICNHNHSLQYQWRSNKYWNGQWEGWVTEQDWSSKDYLNKTWQQAGTYLLYVWARCSEDNSVSNKSQQLTIEVRDPDIYPLTVTSSPSSGIWVQVSPEDENGNSSDTTNFLRSYKENTQVNLTAPETYSGMNFYEWEKSTVHYSYNRQITVTMYNPFTLTAVYQSPPNITVTSPNGNESWQRETWHEITWETDVGGNVKIDLYKGGALDHTIDSSTANDRSRNWLISSEQAADSDYKIKITSTSDTSVYDDSDSDFSITPQSSSELSVTPEEDLNSSGNEGGAFSPSSKQYSVSNSGGGTLSWSVSSDKNWVSVSPASGTDSDTITVSINSNANTLSGSSSGTTHTATVTFSSNGGNTTRDVRLTIYEQNNSILSVTPDSRSVGAGSGTTTFAVDNTGGDTMSWTALVISGGSWLSITSGSSGTNSGTITVAFSANISGSSRTGTIHVEASGASGSPKDVTVIQSFELAPPDKRGSIVAFGSNATGQCDVPIGSDFLSIAAGVAHSLALKADGSLVAWGWNGEGQCNVPVGNDFVAIAARGNNSLALRVDGSIEAWGNNPDAPVGNEFIAIAAGYDYSLALKADGSLDAWGWNAYGQCDVPSDIDFVAIAAGRGHSLALKADGSLRAWGKNTDGQCNVPSGTNFVAIAAGDAHSLALKDDGSIEAWGYNGYGQCDVPAGNDFVAISGGGRHSLAMKADGSLAGWGSNRDWNDSYIGQSDVPSGNDFIAISAGGWHSLTLVVVATVQSVPYTQNFSSGKPSGSDGWEYYSSYNTGRIEVVSGQLRMDSQNPGGFNLNEAILHLNLSGKSGITLTFDHYNTHNGNMDEYDFLPDSFTGHSNGDGLAISSDGTNWHRLKNLDADLNSNFTGREISLDAVVFSAGISYTSDFQIKFQQYDDTWYPYDGRSFDNITIDGLVSVPDVVGLSQAGAESAITSAGLVVGTITYAYNNTVPSGDVISQNPTGGMSVTIGSAVNLHISSGHQVGDFCGANFTDPDGYVDVWDLMVFADHWHTRTGEPQWDSKYDLAGPNFGDPDGYVDVWDLMVFADHWHEGEKP